jgi:glutamine synthetase
VNVYKAEYIWMDGTEPTPLLRSKTKIVDVGKPPPIWGFDGSSTNQAPGGSSDCVLSPVMVVPDPIRGVPNKLVLCEVLTPEMRPHASNTRSRVVEVAKRYERHECWFGMEQEYTFFKAGRPLGWPEQGYPAPQGPYYCSVGENAFGREIVEAHMDACLGAGLAYAGLNAEVMPGQWEFQIGPLDPISIGDHMLLARWLLCRVAEDFEVAVSFDPKPVKGDWNGAGCHTNFSTAETRSDWDAIMLACEALSERAPAHIAEYGFGIEDRLTGKHETCAYTEFRYGVSDRGASLRIPWHVAQSKKGYIEDRRPNANCDPYRVVKMLVETVGGAFSESAQKVA